MDPLSGVASVIAVATLAAQLIKCFADLRNRYSSLPERIHALSNEVTDLAAVLNDVVELSSANVEILRARGPNQTTIPQILGKLSPKLTELRAIAESFTSTSTRRKLPLHQARMWHQCQPQLKTLEIDLRRHKSHLHLILVASNFRELLHIRLEIETINTNVMLTSELQGLLRDDILRRLFRSQTEVTDTLTTMDQRWDQRMARLEQMLGSQPAALPSATSNKSDEALIHTALRPRADAIGFRLRPRNFSCRADCKCVCHRPEMHATPAVLQSVVGQLFLGYTGVPFLRPTCDDPLCEKPLTPTLNLEYWFPIGVFWSLIIQIYWSYHRNLGPSFQMRTLRRVPDNATCVEFAIAGNTEGLKHLFQRGLASPRDVSSTRGYSLLRWALYTKRFETCTFLMHEGADPNYGTYGSNTSEFGSYKVTSKDRARSMLLEPNVSPHSETALRLVLGDDDWIGDCGFTPIHRAVVGLSTRSVEEAIRLFPSDINTTCSGGRTPLAWAALRRDDKAVGLLLDHGANPNATEHHGSTPLYNAAENGSAECCRLLLSAGALPDPPKKKGARLSSALVAAAIDGKEPLSAKILLQFGADIEACGPDGKTALIHAARMNNLTYAALLLDHGANINPFTTAGETPLTTSITYNSHKVLRLLLEHWKSYPECPRKKGPALLPIIARYADHETMSILSSMNHICVSRDPSFGRGSFAKPLRERFDASEEVMLAFKELVMVIQSDEAGWHARFKEVQVVDSDVVQPLAAQQADDDDDEDIFEDALERMKVAA